MNKNINTALKGFSKVCDLLDELEVICNNSDNSTIYGKTYGYISTASTRMLYIMDDLKAVKDTPVVIYKVIDDSQSLRRYLKEAVEVLHTVRGSEKYELIDILYLIIEGLKVIEKTLKPQYDERIWVAA